MNTLFWVGLAQYLFVIMLTLLAIRTRFLVKMGIVLVAIILFIGQFTLTNKEITKVFKENIIKTKLATVEQFKYFEPVQRLRSNIFLAKKKNGRVVYFIAHSFNMNENDDKNIEIPENMGCTGEAWNTKQQIWGDKKRIFEEGRYRVPDEELKKVEKDLFWVCSTPILDRHGNVVAVLNFDGNRDLNEKQIEEIKTHCKKIAEELKPFI